METSPVPALSYKNQLLDSPPPKKKKIRIDCWRRYLNCQTQRARGCWRLIIRISQTEIKNKNISGVI